MKYHLQNHRTTEVVNEGLLELIVFSAIKLCQGPLGTFLNLSHVDIHSSPRMRQLGGCIILQGSGLRA